MARASTGVYRGVGADERRAARRAALLESALELVGSGGWSAATVRAVSAHAKLTTRYFYESFESREALLLALFDAITQEAAADVVAAVAAEPGDAEAKARAAIGCFVDLLVEDPRKARVAFTEAEGNDALLRRRRDGRRLFARLVAEQARGFYGAPPEHVDHVVEVTATLLAGGFAELLIVWLDGDMAATRDELVDDAAALFAAAGGTAAAIARRRASGAETR
ncbi:MAG TPA: TetR/AcrR family transcriptional regulator [Conexibacter sp.]|nr:TetR/AcrR family transcriptional regulator [Conexibacter sp.]